MSALEPPDVHNSTTNNDCCAIFTHCCPTVSCDDPPTCRPALLHMKSCLKSSPSQSGASTPVTDVDDSKALMKKRVAFSEDGTEQVFAADEWDRTPAEIAQRLTYEDVLELKMIQRELPRAEQPYDPLSSRPYSSVFLTHVPIPLLPLNPTTICASSFPTPVDSPGVAFPHFTPSRSNSPPPLPPSQHNTSSLPPSQTQSNGFFRPSRLQEQSREGLSKATLTPTPDRLVVRPHNIPVPPPPVTLRAYSLPPPPPSSTQMKPTPNLPPKRTFSFLPLLDDSSSSSGSPSPIPSVNNTPAAGPSPLAQSPAVSPPPQATALSAPSDPTAFTPSSIISFGQSQVSDADRSDLGYASDCSVTESSTPSLTTASLASSSPPESPGLECDFHVGERTMGKGHLGPRNNSVGSDDESFVLNLDIDADVDLCDSYFPRVVPPSIAMNPIHQRGRSAFTPTHTPTHTPDSSLPPRSRVPVSAFHARHPHLNTTNKPQAESTRKSQPPSPDADTDIHALADPIHKLRLHAIPSPDLDLPVPSPLELPSTMKSPTQQLQRRMLASLMPLAEPAGEVGIKEGDVKVNGSVLLRDQGLLPSLSRAYSCS